LAVNTQTPLVRFRGPGDVRFTTGGVTRMLLPLLRAWRRDGVVREAEWIAMAASEEATSLEEDGLRLSFVALAQDEKPGYALVKEKMWALLNSTPSAAEPHGEHGLPDDAWRAFDAYQRRSAEAIDDAAARMGGLDVAYVQDFQQLGVAEHLRTRAPRVFHLHTPFPRALPPAWRDYVVGQLQRYDAVVASTRRYADNLRAAGLQKPVHVVRPFIDPLDHPPATAAEARAFRERFRVPETDRVVLNVGRMDPMKGQDRLIRAMPRLLERAPDARLVLVGNGSFSSSKKGGLGLSKGEQWRAALEALAADLGVAARVTFTGHLDDGLLPAAYASADAFCLPSTREGFGLAAIEAWSHGKPIVVSDWAGVAELVSEGENGFAIDCADPALLAATLAGLLKDPDAARRIGAAGRKASEEATLPSGRAALERVIGSVVRQEAPVGAA
jgi:glycosyltransferase involved in cell wall biosynthesis